MRRTFLCLLLAFPSLAFSELWDSHDFPRDLLKPWLVDHVRAYEGDYHSLENGTMRGEYILTFYAGPKDVLSFSVCRILVEDLAVEPQYNIYTAYPDAEAGTIGPLKMVSFTHPETGQIFHGLDDGELIYIRQETTAEKL